MEAVAAPSNDATVRFLSQVHLVDSPAMFNLSGSEIVFLLLLALIVLGPEKLPEAVRKFGKAYAEFKKMSTGFQSELKTALDEPMKEMRETAEAFKKAVNFDLEDGDAEDGQSAVVEDEVGQPSPAVAEPAEAAEPADSAAPKKPEVVEAVEETASE
jgi:sec-independent protein translocase protein TatB